jgi:hypothetical protein
MSPPSTAPSPGTPSPGASDTLPGPLHILRRKNHVVLQIQTCSAGITSFQSSIFTVPQVSGVGLLAQRFKIDDEVVLDGEHAVGAEVGVVGGEDLRGYGFVGGFGYLEGLD